MTKALTHQQVFDQTVDHAVKQGEPSYGDRCLYRGPNGRKCFIGNFIPDDLYHMGLEGADACRDDVRAAAPDLRRCQKDFLRELQRCHDPSARHPIVGGQLLLGNGKTWVKAALQKMLGLAGRRKRLSPAKAEAALKALEAAE